MIVMLSLWVAGKCSANYKNGWTSPFEPTIINNIRGGSSVVTLTAVYKD